MSPLFRRLELSFHTQYTEVRERSLAEGPLLPGTPGTLALRKGTGYGYWYRRFYNLPNQETETLLCKEGDEAALAAMQERMAAAAWCQEQVRLLRKLGMQVADKNVARLLVELHNLQLFQAGLVVVGTLAFMAWLNELGVLAVSARTQDVDLARRQALKLATPLSFLESVAATELKLYAVPGIPHTAPSTSVKQAGAAGLRVDVLTSGLQLGTIVPIPELNWHAQTVPHFNYLLQAPNPAVVLAGGHCVPVNLPQVERLVWHKLYASTQRGADHAKARKDLLQACVLGAAVAEADSGRLADTAPEAPAELRRAARQQLPAMKLLLQAHPQAMQEFELALAGT